MRITNLVVAFVTGSLAISSAFAADVCATPSNVVANCGFETGSFSSWVISGTDSAASNNGIYYGIENSSQYSGNDAAYFGAVGGQILLSQTLSNLIVSDVYTITIEAFNDTTPVGNYINNLNISLGVNSYPVASQVAAGSYTLYTVQASPFTASSTLSISSRNDAGFWNIDSISAVQTGTPEPSAFVLLGIGLALLLLLKHRARTATGQP